ncbi:MAG TPA: class I SAM-dependent methyltransferase [Bacteroidia bacterium]|nr:class I SAM-dependent methyltransferase [Bacteroidia bacterium]
MSDYLKINKLAWNQVVQKHFDSDFYNVRGFLEGIDPLNEPELSLLGNINEKSLLHLQCHFGMDTLALAKRGATCTGVDFSEKAIEKAHVLSEMSKIPSSFICKDIYSLKEEKLNSFDIVFTSYGTIGWLPDLDQWANIISEHLKPGGLFVMADFHPLIWMFDENFSSFKFRYFNSGPIEEEESGSYADSKSSEKRKTIGWNHAISEILNSLIKAGLTIERFDEYDYSPYDCFSKCVEISNRKYRIEGFENKLPMVYAIRATKR